MRPKIYLICANLLFGLSYSVIISLVDGWLNFRQLFLVQMIMGALLFAPSLRPRRGARRLAAGELVVVAMLAATTLFGWVFLLLWGGSLSTPMDMASLATLSPSFTLITSYLLGRERINLWRVVGIAISLVGGAILITNRFAPGESPSTAHGNMLIAAATLFMAINTVVVKPTLARHGAARLLGIYYIIALAVALPLMGGELTTIELANATPQRWAELGYLAVAGSAAPLYLLYIGAEHTRPIYTALFRYIQPIITLAVVLWRGDGELDEVNLMAGWVILIGFIFIFFTRRAAADEIIK